MHNFFLIIPGIFLLVIVLAGLLFLILNRTNGSLLSSGETRRYLLYVPRTYDQTRSAPLVIVLHGLAEWPAHIQNVSGWNKLADQYGFLIVYPSGTGFPKRWAASDPDDSTNGGTKDVIFLTSLIDKLESEYNIDPARIYVNGFSNGGGMSFLLGCKLSDRIAAVGAVSGAYLFPLDRCQTARSVPMILFHGTADPVIPHKGGPTHSFKVTFPSIQEWTISRAMLNQCDTNPVPLPSIGKVSGLRYENKTTRADVDYYQIEGHGHGWPGGKSLPKWLAGNHSNDISATKTMWAFFLDHPLVKTDLK